MPSIFISYRRSDSQADAGRIYDRLATHFGKKAIFKDVDDIPPGVDFRDFLNDMLNQCQVVLAIIGPNWLNAVDDEGRQRLKNPSDWVRLELEESLRRQDVLLVPLLVSYAEMPRVDELPESLQNLAYRNYREARPDPDFHKDMGRLIEGLEQYFAKSSVFELPQMSPLLPSHWFQRWPQKSTTGKRTLVSQQPGLWVGIACIGLLGAWGISRSLPHFSSLNRDRSETATTPSTWGSPESPDRNASSSQGWGARDSTQENLDEPEDYRRLRGLLNWQDWDGADRHTLDMMGRIAGQEDKAYLHLASIKNFPCDDLEQIDRLWAEASDRRFSFSTQKEIYVGDCEGPVDGSYTEDSWTCFGEAVGWRDHQDEWMLYSQLAFDLEADAGHLPGIFVREIDGGNGKAREQIAALMARMRTCQDTS